MKQKPYLSGRPLEMPRKRVEQRFLLVIIAGLVVLCLCGLAGAYSLPPVKERLAWRIDELKARLKYAISPPQEVVFVPQAATSRPTQQPVTETPTLSPTIALSPVGPTETTTPEPTATLTPTPLPPASKLTGIIHEYQMWNNCGPANLAMALSYWGWKGDQRETAAYLKPNQRDKNVMPYEMVAFVEENTDLEASMRVGGDLQMLKALVAGGFPVIVEKGFEGPSFDGWMGHYEVVNGYDDARQVFYVQDSYKGPDLEVAYEDMQHEWRAFNNTYIVPYPAERRQALLNILGLQAYDNFNFHAAEQLASREIPQLTGRDLYFALFNQGSNLVYLKDYTAAAAAFDAAFANYALIPEEQRPWRMLWYTTTPYFAYYYTGRYQDVINLATTTLDAMSEPILEESYYWRGMAKLALGDTSGAIEDFKKSVEVHPGFLPGLEQLRALGVSD